MKPIGQIITEILRFYSSFGTDTLTAETQYRCDITIAITLKLTNGAKLFRMSTIFFSLLWKRYRIQTVVYA